ncbi:MAG: replication restart helicase PriA [Planctomycetota bacterium]|jgi:primosomal protein N' (replication factor Y)
MQKIFAGVVIEAPLTTIYHYRVPEILRDKIECGMRVTIPFGPRSTKGFVVSFCDTPPIEESRIKEILDLGSGKVLANEEILDLTKWIAGYYCCGWGEVLAAALPAAVRKGMKKKTIQYAALAISDEAAGELAFNLETRARKQSDLLRYLIGKAEGVKVSDLEEAGVAGRASVKSLEEKGAITISAVPLHRELATISEKQKDIILTEGQKNAVAEICSNLDKKEYQTYLLHGATSSGKTEVYLRALEHCLAQGRSGIVLVPEISLTPQTVERFRSRVGEVAVLHSNMAAGERAEEWQRLRKGEVKVAVGARSAIFSPLPDLGLIVIDEEHERTFKQDTTPRYHARSVAIMRARSCGASVILGSATPCLESYQNALEGKFKLLELPHRAGAGSVPQTRIVDMRSEWAEVKKQAVLSRVLIKAVKTALGKKEQSILFLNRRGFNTWIHCLNCKSTVTCPDCDISLTYHKYNKRLSCHYCDYAIDLPENCPDCSSPQLRFAGSGTEKVEDAVAEAFPDANILRMDSDTMTSRDSHAEALSAFARGEYDILLGTQMIAKGLDFPNVTVIGVISADGSINLPDFRAAENTFQLVTQVVGRSGRGDLPGYGIIQAFSPDHYAVQLAAQQDYKAFVKRELKDRKIHLYPPFGRFARIMIKGPDRNKCFELAKQAAASLRAASSLRNVLGPSPCSIAKIQANFRFHLLVKAGDPKELLKIVQTGLSGIKPKGKIRMSIDIDPVSLL